VALRRAVGGAIEDSMIPVHSTGMPLALTMAAQLSTSLSIKALR
jgi:hypothetical protein